VKSAANAQAAKKIAETVATSPLVKTAMFGNDANWGRIIAAAGRAGVKFNPDKTDVFIGNILVFKNGMPAKFSEIKAKQILKQKKVTITLDLKQGNSSTTYYTCDFSFDYIKINASYRS
jgi:glutamate N-acetyltransferase/amino-acid N-acetyltransferase